MEKMDKLTPKIQVINGPTSQQADGNRVFWNFINNSDDTAELNIEGTIASQESWWSDVITPKKFKQDLASLGPKSNITVRINSGGGDVFAANTIHNLLKEHAANITAKIDYAASAATIIAMAANEIAIPASSYMMVHDPAYGLMGYYNADELTKMATDLGVIKNGIINAYVAKTGKSKEELAKMMKEETWMTGEDAVAQGFADKLMYETNPNNAVMNGNLFVVNNVSHDLSGFKNSPIPMSNGRRAPVPIINESNCKCSGCSQTKDDCSCSDCGICPNCCDNQSCCGCSCQMDKQCSSTTVSNCQNKIKNKEGKKVEIKTIDELRQHYPELVNQVENAAKEAGAVAERTRIKSIDEISNTVPTELVVKAKYDEPMTAQDLAFQALKANAAAGTNYQETRAAEIAASGVRNITGGDGGNEDVKLAEDQAINNIVNGADGKRGK